LRDIEGVGVRNKLSRAWANGKTWRVNDADGQSRRNSLRSRARRIDREQLTIGWGHASKRGNREGLNDRSAAGFGIGDLQQTSNTRGETALNIDEKADARPDDGDAGIRKQVEPY